MKKLEGIVSAELDESFDELAKRLGIDLKRFKPVRFEMHPFFLVYCVDLDKSAENQEWFTKFEVILLDIDRVDELIEKFNLNVSTDKKYLDKEPDKIAVIEYPNQ